MRKELVPMKYIIEIKSLHNIQGIDYKLLKILCVIIRIIYFLVHEDPNATYYVNQIIT